MRSALAQDVRRHRGSCRLAMHSRDDDPAFARHDRGQRLRATHEWFTRSPRAHEDRIVLLDRRRKNHHFVVVRILRTMLPMEAQSEPDQALGLDRADLVRPAHLMAKLEQKRGDAAHPTSRHADQMDAVSLPREQRWQIDFRGERHDSVAYTFPSFPPRGRLRFLAPVARNFGTCAAVWAGRRLTPQFSARATRSADRTPSK